MDCIFCGVVAGKIPSYTVFEDVRTKAFLDIYPATDGHTVVILKKHGDTILDYDQGELGYLWFTVRKVAKAMQKAYNTNILSIGINHGEPSGVHHLHVHVMPRFAGDSGGIVQSLPSLKPSSGLSSVLGKIIKEV